MEPVDTLTQAREFAWTQPALKELGQCLPTDDDSLDRLIAEAVRQRDETAFRRLVFAALGTDRTVDARHLVDGGALFLDLGELSNAAMHCAGDVGPALIAAAQGGRMGWEREAAALTMAGLWFRERGVGPYPPELVAAARKLARNTSRQPLVQVTLCILAEAVDDKTLKALLPTEPAERLKDMEQGLLQRALDSPWSVVPASPPPAVLTGYTVRRAAPRVGRNEPCPCGSGKKYKNCCIDRDQDRLRQSSALPGVTLKEWQAQPELGLTWQRLRDMRSYELVKLDPHKVPVPLRANLVDRLIEFNELEAAVRVLEVGESEDPDDHFYWDWVAELAARRGEVTLLERLLALRPGVDPATLGLDLRLRLAGEDGSRQLDMVEAEASRALRGEPPVRDLVQLAYCLMASRAPALGLLVARGVLPLAGGLDGDMVLMDMLDVRDQLGLSPDEPMEEIYNDLLSQSEEKNGQESEELTQARHALELKGDEVRKLKSELISLHGELEKRQKQRATPAASTPGPVQPGSASHASDDPALAALRVKVRSLRDLLKERHTERNELRRELEVTREQLQAIQVQSAPSVAGDPLDESLLLDEEDLGQQPVRLPAWPRKFVQHLGNFPRPVGRSVMLLVGRLAAGEPAAFAGVKRLRALPDVYRQRVAGHYRLLFRLRSDCLEVLELVNRKDLDRAIKAMT